MPRLGAEEREVLLELARLIAHGTDDRKNAPLACYLAGLAATGAGSSPAAAMATARARLDGP